MGAGADDGAILRAKYLDWCSARVAERFVSLAPEEVYELAQRTRSASGSRGGQEIAGTPETPDGGAAPASSFAALAMLGAEVESFRMLVERLTVVLSAELDLPPFEVWAEAYRSDPAKYDGDLLGFWRDVV
jgi:hypothetical protein